MAAQESKTDFHAETTAIDMEGATSPKSALPDETGLRTEEVIELRKKFGYNEITEKQRPLILRFLSYFWGPMPVVLWIAIIVKTINTAITGQGVADIVVLVALQVLNGIIGFREEYAAGNAIGELKKAMVAQCTVLRDGEWKVCPSRELVPGDVVALKLGDVVPADCTITSGGPFEVDQSALTGESLSVMLEVGAVLLMGSAVKQGKGSAVVETTGSKTQLGRSAALVASVQVQDHLHLMLMRILVGLSCLAAFVFAFTFIALLIANVGNDFNVPGSSNFLRALGISIAILISSIPVAMQIVATATLALGAHELTSRGVIVARLSCMEELAAMSVLCSDKTGTLTENKLTLYDAVPLAEEMSKDQILLFAALASEPEVTQQDAIDSCITQALPMTMQGQFQSTTVLQFEHFNPITKRSVAVVSKADGTRMRVMKGAPQAVAALCDDKNNRNAQANEVIGDFASRGYRALSIAASESETGPLELVGIIALYDPPRADTVETIEQLLEFGITVKMITGDNLAIAKEMCHELMLGDNVVSCHQLDELEGRKNNTTGGIILHASGFAEAMPQHKFTIVEALRGTGCLVGMTGDGVNDAPALKRADVGIAVGGATDAARAAADLVLTKPGLSVIVDAIVASRQVFQRIRTYVLYKTAITVQISVFFFVSILLINPSNPYFYGPIDPAAPNHNTAFTLPVTAIVIITILNDLCVISMSRDSVVANKLPGQWDLRLVLAVALIMGLIQAFGTVLLLVIVLHASPLHPGSFAADAMGAGGIISFQACLTILYLQLALSNSLTIFSARTRSFLWERRPGNVLLFAMVASMIISTVFALFWSEIFTDEAASLRYSGTAVVFVWIYTLIWLAATDLAKVMVYRAVPIFQDYATVVREKRQSEIIAHQQSQPAPSAATSARARAGSRVARQRSSRAA